jgi:DNA-binding IclR family transcriptional regulator
LAIPSAKARVLAAIQAGYLDATITELATRINLTHEACYRALRTLCDDGHLKQTGRGTYALA